MARRKSIARGSEKLTRLADPGRSRWLVATYRPVSLFSLRMTHATSKGGKTLVVPTPYAIKMALVDASFRVFAPDQQIQKAQDIFDLVKWREVRVRPPKHCVVQNTFVKILDREREGDLPFKQTIAYREFAFFSDDENGGLSIALAVGGLSQTEVTNMAMCFAHVNSLGKRGSFVQFLGTDMWEGELPIGFTVPLGDPLWRGVNSYGMIQALDDFGEELCKADDGFDRVSTYGKGTIKLGEHRVLIPTAIPYRRRSAARSFTWYERID